MAPTFSGKFFDEVVRNTLGDEVHTGWGMDYVWPYLLGWTRDSVAVIDGVCMLHNSDPWKSNRMYYVDMSFDPRDEWDITLSRYNITENVVRAAGMEWKRPTVFGEVQGDTVRLFICIITHNNKETNYTNK